ncbi:hypothetical protein Tco_0317272 [Tanacetum coccineum]
MKICHILDSQRLSLITSSPSSNLSRSSNFQHFHTIQWMGTVFVSRLKFGKRVKIFSAIWSLAHSATMLNNEIIQSKSYKMFILYSTGQIPLETDISPKRRNTKQEVTKPDTGWKSV